MSSFSRYFALVNRLLNLLIRLSQFLIANYFHLSFLLIILVIALDVYACFKDVSTLLIPLLKVLFSFCPMLQFPNMKSYDQLGPQALHSKDS
jgi:hypothetical protein